MGLHRSTLIAGALLLVMSSEVMAKAKSNWDDRAPLMISEVMSMVTPESAQLVRESQGVWLLEAMGGGKPQGSMSAFTQAVQVYINDGYRYRSFKQFFSALMGTPLPDSLAQYAGPIHSYLGNVSLLAALQQCLAQGDSKQQAMCDLIAVDYAARRYKPSQQILQQAQVGLIDKEHYLDAILDVSQFILDDRGERPDMAIEDEPLVMMTGPGVDNHAILVALGKKAIVKSVMLIRQIHGTK